MIDKKAEIKKKNKKKPVIKTSNILIFIYNVSNYEFEELSKFKGFVNLMTIFAVLNFFLIKSKFNYITIIFLIPNIMMSGSSASVLGTLIGIFLCFIFF